MTAMQQQHDCIQNTDEKLVEKGEFQQPIT